MKQTGTTYMAILFFIQLNRSKVILYFCSNLVKKKNEISTKKKYLFLICNNVIHTYES